MKINKILIAALLGGVSFASCSNDDGLSADVNKGTQSMVLKLSGLSNASVRGTGAPVADQTVAAFDDIKVYFADVSGKIVAIESLDNTSEDWALLQGAGYVFHEVPATASQVCVVGNASGKADIASIAVNGNVSALKTAAMKISGEQTFNEVTLFGSDETLTESTSTDDPHTSNGKVLEAEVNLAPVVSRFEIGNIQCTNGGTKFDQIVLNHVGIIGFNDQAVLGTGAAAGTAWTSSATDADKNLILGPGSTPVAGKFIFGSTSDAENDADAYANVAWAWDAAPAGVDLANKELKHNPDAGKYVYQFVPNGGSTQVKLTFSVNQKNVGPLPNYNSVATARLVRVDGAALTWEAGKVYTMDFPFAEENIGPWNPDETTCVNVTVTVHEWEVIQLKPEFQ